MPYDVQGAALAPIATGMLSSGHFRRLLIILTAITLAFTLIATQTPAATEASTLSDAERVMAFARSHIGKRFRMGAEGMRYFDCSGLVYRVYEQAGVLNKIGGSRRLAAGYYRWFRERGLLARSNPRVGDLIWWQKNGRVVHTGLSLGSNQAISALINPYGVSKHSVGGVGKFLAFGRVRLDR